MLTEGGKEMVSFRADTGLRPLSPLIDGLVNDCPMYETAVLRVLSDILLPLTLATL